MFEKLKSLDTQLFLFINGFHNAFFDRLMVWASGRLFWIPFYVLMVFLLVRKYRKESWKIFAAIAVAITLSDQITSHLIKPAVQRYRPSHEPALEGLVHLSTAGPGGMYGFASSHAANAFALAAFLWFALPDHFKWLRPVVIFWATLVSYSRIYNGVHYPLDVMAGSAIGAVLGWLIFKAFLRFSSPFKPKRV